MEFSPQPSLLERLRRFALDVDAWVSASLYEAGRRSADLYERFAARMDKLSLSGGQRFAADLASEAVTIGAAGSVLMLALAVPAFRETSDDWLKKSELAVTFLDRYGAEIGKRGIRHDDSLALDEFPDHFVQAVLATEDRRFDEHWGIDPLGTFRALTANARASGVVQGGSSITQQLAKNLFLNNERTLERKIKEAFLALWLETRLTKQEILKLYLDRAYMGGGAFGAAAAAEYFFGKSVRDVTLAEAAMLAGLFKAPSKYAPHVNLPAARARANTVLTNMVEAGFLTQGQIQAALRNPATPIDRKRDPTPDYYLDWAFGEIRDMSDRGLLGNDRVLTVKTPLDRAIQQKAEATVDSMLRQYGQQYRASQAALVVMEPDGAVRAMVGGRDYGLSQFNRALALRQPGSSFKTYVYTAAMMHGRLKPTTTVTDQPTCIGNWCVNNYGRSFSGSMPATVAFAKSVNTIPVQFSRSLGNGDPKAGRARIIDTAKRMGLTTPLPDQTSLPIGSAEVTVLDQASAYALFANGGKRAKPFAAVEIANSHGDVIWRQDRNAPPPEQVVPPSVVADMNVLLTAVVEAGTARRADISPVRAGGKTGTTDGYKDAWFVGLTGNLVAAVWYGNDDSAEMNNMTGGTVPAMTWQEVMAFAHQGIELKPLPGLPEATAPAVARAQPQRPAVPGTEVPTLSAATLSRQSFEVLSGIERGFTEGKARRVQAPAAQVPAAQVPAAKAPVVPAPRAEAPPAPEGATLGMMAIGGRAALP